MEYYIKATYHYYSGTFNAPKDGAVKDEYGKRLEFDSVEDAEKYLLNELGGTKSPSGKNLYFPKGIYHLSHGEYSQPEYSIRKIRSSK